eukprot:1193257-Prorocentrum_minimum.AAC.3
MLIVISPASFYASDAIVVSAVVVRAALVGIYFPRLARRSMPRGGVMGPAGACVCDGPAHQLAVFLRESVFFELLFGLADTCPDPFCCDAALSFIALLTPPLVGMATCALYKARPTKQRLAAC